jgi:3-methyladenine DNA glycosylase/8-oxoguanine DNA glycosylase
MRQRSGRVQWRGRGYHPDRRRSGREPYEALVRANRTRRTRRRGSEALITRLVSIKGVGHWTVEVLLMYSLERMDVLPASDFGVREGYRVLKSLPEQPTPATLRELAQAWSPHRAVAAWYLWRIPRSRGRALA